MLFHHVFHIQSGCLHGILALAVGDQFFHAFTQTEAPDEAIEELRQEGKLAELSIKYFGSDITSE